MLFADGTHICFAKISKQLNMKTQFDEQLMKGDLANKLGFVYAPKTDERQNGSSLKEKF